LLKGMEIFKGLENVPIKETVLSSIDGEQGKLYYVGYSIEELVEHSSYEEVCFLLLNHRLPKRKELEDYVNMLKAERKLPSEVMEMLSELPSKSPFISVLRAHQGNSFIKHRW
jgi:citrate synthase